MARREIQDYYFLKEKPSFGLDINSVKTYWHEELLCQICPTPFTVWFEQAHAKGRENISSNLTQTYFVLP